MPPELLVIIPCSAVKTAMAVGSALPAGELYAAGSYHRMCRRAGEALIRCGGELRVLSAKFGLIALEDRIAPYDLRVGQPGSVDGQQLRRQVQILGLERAKTVIVLAGRAYAQPVAEVWPAVLRPLAGTRGIGEQRGRLSRIANVQDPLATAAAYAGHAEL
ncbi:DUF6884 domain-containing protein [Streptomyces sp. NPDC090442]|uniref:DUF6884 domain-containing protein n=1 Tax=Streptomyces sp. NPDC090442 TaxID=3365962 RepID=UPI0038251E1D